MNKTLFIVLTIIFGIFIQVFLNHYVSLAGATPQALLLFVVSIGFVTGPIMALTVGFFWGLLSDSMGIRLFGMNAFLLSFAGYIAGKLRRRVASERLAGQVVSGLIATFYFQIGVWLLHRIFEERTVAFVDGPFFMRILFNLLIVSLVFIVVDRWITMWRLEAEH